MRASTPWTALVAVYGAVVATASLVVAVLAYRSGGPRIKPSTWLCPATGDQNAELVISIVNRGRSEGTVNRIYLNVPGPHSIVLHRRKSFTDRSCRVAYLQMRALHGLLTRTGCFGKSGRTAYVAATVNQARSARRDVDHPLPLPRRAAFQPN
jgi:hypothetical protein